MKFKLDSTQVSVEVEVGVELAKIFCSKEYWVQKCLGPIKIEGIKSLSKEIVLKKIRAQQNFVQKIKVSKISVQKKKLGEKLVHKNLIKDIFL